MYEFLRTLNACLIRKPNTELSRNRLAGLDDLDRDLTGYDRKTSIMLCRGLAADSTDLSSRMHQI